MKRVLILVLFTIMLVSCPMIKTEPYKMTVNAVINGEEIENSYTHNIDNSSLGNIIFNAGLFNKDGTEYTGATVNWVISDSTVQLMPYGSGQSVMLLSSSLKRLGSYVITATYNNLTSSFLLNIISNVEDIKLEYEILAEYNDSNLYPALTGEIVSGEITPYDSDKDLARGGVYKITAKDIADDETNTIGQIVAESDDNNVAYIRNIVGATCYLVVQGKERETVRITVALGNTSIKRVFILTVKDVGITIIEKKVIIPSSDEMEISLTQSGEEETYILKEKNFVSNRLLYSIDAEKVYQQRYYDGSVKEYIPEINPDAHWTERTTFSWSWEDNGYDTLYTGFTYWQAHITGNEITFIQNEDRSIRRDTVFNFNSEDKNLHSYIYVKYDTDTVWRFKIRVYIGGVLDELKIELEENGAYRDIDEGKITINIGDKMSYRLKVSGTPKTSWIGKSYVFYLSSSVEEDVFLDKKGYRFKAPRPSKSDNDSVYATRKANIRLDIWNTLDVNESAYTEIMSGSPATFETEHSWQIDNTTTDNLNFSVVISGNGTDFVLVVMEKSTHKYITLTVEDTAEKVFVLKSVSGGIQTNENGKYRLIDKNCDFVKYGYDYKKIDSQEEAIDNLKFVEKDTVYYNTGGNLANITQTYPQTADGYMRKFYIDMEKTLKLDFDSNFEIYDIQFVPLSPNAYQYGGDIITSINYVSSDDIQGQFGYGGSIYFKSAYASMDGQNKFYNNQLPLEAMTDDDNRNELLYRLTINNEMNANIKIILTEKFLYNTEYATWKYRDKT